MSAVRTAPAKPAALVLMSMSSFALVPLTIDVSGGQDSPWLFSAVAMSARSATIFMFLAATRPHLFAAGGFLRQIGADWRRWARDPLMLLIVAAQLKFGLLVWSTSLVDTAVTTALLEMWSLWFILMLASRWGSDATAAGTRAGLPSRFGWSMAVVLVGFVLVVAAQAGGFGGLMDGIRGGSSSAPLGIALGLGAGVVSALNAAASLVMGGRMAGAAGPRSADDMLSGSLATLAVAGFAAAPVSAALALLVGSDGWQIGMPSVAAAVAVGAGFDFVGMVLLRKANLAGVGPAVNALYYLGPCLSLGLLWAFTEVEVPSTGMLLAGAGTIVAGNVMLHLSAAPRTPQKHST